MGTMAPWLLPPSGDRPQPVRMSVRRRPALSVPARDRLRGGPGQGPPRPAVGSAGRPQQCLVRSSADAVHLVWTSGERAAARGQSHAAVRPSTRARLTRLLVRAGLRVQRADTKGQLSGVATLRSDAEGQQRGRSSRMALTATRCGAPAHLYNGHRQPTSSTRIDRRGSSW